MAVSQQGQAGVLPGKLAERQTRTVLDKQTEKRQDSSQGQRLMGE